MKTQFLIIKILLLSWVVLTGCNQNPCPVIEISQVSLSEIQNNILQFRIQYNLSKPEVSGIKIWEKDKSEDVRELYFDSSKEIDEVVYGFKANTSYQIQVFTKSQCSSLSEVVEFKTKQLPFDVLNQINLVSNSGEFEGFLLFQMLDIDNNQFQVIINENGEVVWYQQFQKESSTFSLTPENTIVTLLKNDEIVEYKLNGELLFQLAFPSSGFTNKMHHEIRKNNDGLYYGLTYYDKYLDESQKLEYKVDTLTCDGIIVLNDKGEKIWEWNMLQISYPDPKTFKNKRTENWGHANSLWQDQDGDFLVSFRNFSQIWKIKYPEGNVVWKLGQDGDFQLSEDAFFLQQHAAVITEEGNLLLFDNGSIKDSISSALQVRLNFETKEGFLNSKISLPKRLFSFKRGNSLSINSELTMINSTMSNTIVVMNKADSIVWELKLPYRTYRVEYLDSIY